MRLTSRQLRRLIRESLTEAATPQTKMSDDQVSAAAKDGNLKGRLVTIAVKGDWSKLKMYVDRYGPWNFIDILEDSSTTEHWMGEQQWGWADRAEEKGGEKADFLENDAIKAVEAMAKEWFKSNVLQANDEGNWEALSDAVGLKREYEEMEFMKSLTLGVEAGYDVVPKMDLADAAKVLPHVEENDRDFIDDGFVPEHLVFDEGRGPVAIFDWSLEEHGTTMDSFTEFLGRMGFEPEEFKAPEKKRKKNLKPETLTKQQWNAVLNSVSKSGEGGRSRQSSISQDDAMDGFLKAAKKYMLQDVYDGKVFSKVYSYAESRGIGAKWGEADYAELEALRQEDHDYMYGD